MNDYEKHEAMRRDLEKICKPLEEFIYEYGDPYTTIAVDMSGVRVLQDECGINFKVRD